MSRHKLDSDLITPKNQKESQMNREIEQNVKRFMNS